MRVTLGTGKKSVVVAPRTCLSRRPVRVLLSQAMRCCNGTCKHGTVNESNSDNPKRDRQPSPKNSQKKSIKNPLKKKTMPKCSEPFYSHPSQRAFIIHSLFSPSLHRPQARGEPLTRAWHVTKKTVLDSAHHGASHPQLHPGYWVFFFRQKLDGTGSRTETL